MSKIIFTNSGGSMSNFEYTKLLLGETLFNKMNNEFYCCLMNVVSHFYNVVDYVNTLDFLVFPSEDDNVLLAAKSSSIAYGCPLIFYNANKGSNDEKDLYFTETFDALYAYFKYPKKRKSFKRKKLGESAFEFLVNELVHTFRIIISNSITRKNARAEEKYALYNIESDEFEIGFCTLKDSFIGYLDTKYSLHKKLKNSKKAIKEQHEAFIDNLDFEVYLNSFLRFDQIMEIFIKLLMVQNKHKTSIHFGGFRKNHKGKKKYWRKRKIIL
jgi:hypothetical protein